VDHGVHVLQIDLTPTNTSSSPKLVHALLISLILNDSKIDRHNNTTMTQHTSPILYFHIDAIQRKKEAPVSYSQNIHIPEGTSVSSSKFTKKRSLKVP
jgi:hypothetical protein